MANDLWRWADPNGQQRKVRLDELRASLASGIIAPNAPVWRAGWSGWRHAHEVPELTSASVGGANGVVLNIPPPPLAMVAVQHQYEAAGDSIMPSPSSAPPDAAEEPPPPPAYVPIPAKAPSIAPPSTSLKTQMAGSTTTTGGVLPAPPAPKLGPSLATQIGVPPPPTEPSLGPPSVEELSTSALIDSPSSPETANRVSTDGLGMPPPTVPIILTPGEAMDASLIGLPRRSPLAPLLDDIAAVRRGEKPRNRNLLIVVGVVGLMLAVLVVAGIAGLFGGPEKPARTAASASASGKPKAIASVTSATATASATAVATIPPPPPPAETAAPADTVSFSECSSAGDDRPIAPRAVVTAGIEAQALNGGLALGFAAAPRDGVALQLDPGALSVTSTVHARPAADLRRVTPMLVGGKLAPMPDVDRRGDKIASRRAAATATPADVGVVDGNIVWAPHGKDSSAVLFPLEGDTPIEAMRVVATSNGLVLAFRRGNAIHVGAAKGEGTLEADGELSRIVGLGQTGSPALAVSGDKVVVAWADRAGQGSDWVVRWARAKVGATIQSSEAQVLGTSGGLGAPFMSPSLTSLGGGHFLVAWSEGPVSGHQVRAMTIGADGSAGEPITISGPSSNAGQPAAVVGPDGRGLVAFLATKGKSFELHATPIHCK